MRPGLRDSGWAGSLFPEPIEQVKVPSDRCACHQDCPQYETCETEALDKSSKIYYLLRCVKGKFPACANCMCMACDRYHECEDGPERGQPGGTRYRMCNRPISITGCPDYSGPIPWISEAACKKCDHVCGLRKELVWAPRVRCNLNPIEPTKKPTEEPSAVQLDGKPTVEHPMLIHYGHETWGRYELEGRLVEEFISTDRPVRKESEFAADMVAVDAARKAAGDLPLARSFIEKGARGIRVYEDPALQEGGTLCCHLVVSKQNGGLCTGCSDQRGTPCSYSRPAEHTSPEPAVAPAKPAKAKKPKLEPAPAPFTKNDQEIRFLRSDIVAIDRLLSELPADHVIERLGFESRKQEHEERLAILTPAVKPWNPEKGSVAKKWEELHCGKHHACRDDCAGLRSGALCPFIISLSFLKSIVREGSLPADVLDDRMKDDAEAKAAKKLAKVTKPEPAPAVKPAKEPMAVLLDGKWYSDGKEISEVEARTGAPCDQEHACVIVADPKGKAYDSRYPCRCFHCKGNQGPCGSKCGLYPEGTTGGKHGGCCMVQHKAKSRAEVELGVT